MRDPRLQRFVLAHFLTVVAEWAAVVGVLVHAYGWGGPSAVGLVSLAVLAPPLVCAPLAANLTARYPAHRVRLASFAVQTTAFSAATIAASLGSATPVVAVFVVVSLGAINTLRPTGAVLLPAVVHSTQQLVAGNLWVSYGDSSSALIGPLVAAALGGVGGSSAVFASCAVAGAIAFAATAWRPAPLTRTRTGGSAAGPPRRVMRSAITELFEHQWTIGILAVSAARNVVVGAFDVLLVIVALRALQLGERGPGLLSALVGVGAVASTVVVTVAVRRTQLRQALVGALSVAAVICVVVGVRVDATLVFVVLPVLGLCLSLMDNLSRIMLQRSTEPRNLGPLFACLGLAGGVGQLFGSAVAQGLLALAGLDVALVGIGVILAVVAIASLRALRRADAHADVPVVEMTLLGALPLFSTLPASMLEAVSRSAEAIDVADGQRVITEGETGDTFYAVADGDFDIVVGGQHIRTATPGDFFGEVALLANVPRTATVICRGPGALLAIRRRPFLIAVTGHDVCHAAALDHVNKLQLQNWELRSGDGGADRSPGD